MDFRVLVIWFPVRSQLLQLTFKVSPLCLASGAQSFNFLVDVDDFKHAVHAAFDPNNKEAAAGEDFHKYLAIVKEYIESNARSEVRDRGHEGLGQSRSKRGEPSF